MRHSEAKEFQSFSIVVTVLIGFSAIFRHPRNLITGYYRHDLTVQAPFEKFLRENSKK